MKLSALRAEATAFLHLRDLDDVLLYEKKLDTQDGVEVEVDDETKPVGLTMYGPGTKVYAKASQAKQNKIFDRMKKKGKFEMTAEETLEENATFLAACTKELHFLEPDAEAGVDPTKAVYMDQATNVAEQAAKFVADWANFKKPSTTT
jgi:hypothetical protein